MLDLLHLTFQQYMNEPNINYSHTYPVNKADWVDDNLMAVDESAQMESEFDLPVEERVEPQTEIANRLDELASYLSELKQQFSDRLERDATKDKAFEYLYDELETAKQDSNFERFKPLYLDLILLFDRLDRVCCQLDRTTSTTNNFYNFLQTLREELLEVLYRQGIEIVTTQSNRFDPTQQRAIATETTMVREENNSLASLVRRGFRYQNRLVRPEEVIVKKYRG